MFSKHTHWAILTPVKADQFFEKSDALFIADRSGIILWQNPAGQAFGANSLKDLVGETWRDLCQTWDYQVSSVKLQSNGEAYSAVVVDCSSALDRPTFLIALKRFTDDALKHAEVREFLSIVAHDLKNPLAAVFGYADLLLDTAAGQGLTEAQRDILLSIRRISRRSIEFVRNCEYLNAASDQNQALAVFHADVNAILSTVIDHLIRDGDKAPSLEFLPSSEQLATSAHPTQVERIASNLLTNAIKYTPLTEKIFIRSWIQDHNPYFSVQNTGVAIPLEEHAQIFDRNVRGSTSSGTSGSGIGLYIVKKIAATIGAEIKLESQPKSGTTFTVKLPAI